VALSRLDELELERYKANFGWALLHGLPLDPTHLPIIPHLRGSVIFGALLVPLLWLLGPTLVALKLLAVLWGAWIVALATALAERHLARPAAWLVLVLCLFATPSYLWLDVLAQGSHVDSIIFILLPLWWAGRSERGVRRAIGFGTLIGLGVPFSMQFLVASPGIAAYCLWRWRPDPKAAVRSAKSVAVGVLAATPWLALVPCITRNATLVNQAIDERFLPHGWSGAWERLEDLLRSDLRRSWLLEEHGLGWFALVLCLLFGCGALWLWLELWRALGATRGPGITAQAETGNAPQDPARLGLYALPHVLGLALAYAISDFKLNLVSTADGMGSRYLMPI
jgi:4-amino-4-deoxy-L-arabinose transferase-like glycosyltransferase